MKVYSVRLGEVCCSLIIDMDKAFSL